jgi:peptidyl-prolyl cis-trans isomerase D
MIQWMHGLSKSFLATLMMGVLALSFVVWGVGDIFTGATRTAVASVGGTNIEMTDFQRTYRNFLRQQGERMGGMEITPEMARSMGLGQTALQQMIDRVALDNYVAAQGLTASDADVAQAIRSIDGFKGASGQFEYMTFQRALQIAGYTEDQFTRVVRADMARNQLTAGVELFFGVPGEYTMALYQYVNEKRAADYVLVPGAAAGEIALPDDRTLAAFVKENTARFSTPEYRDVQFAYATAADAAVTVTDKMLEDEYTARKATYVVPERRELSQLEFKSQAEANAARARITSGTSFEALVKERGLTPTDVSLGVKSAEELGDAAAAKAAFAVGANEVSQPVQGTFAWLLLKTGKITPGSSRTLDDVREELRVTVQQQLVAQKMDELLNAYEEARNKGENLAAAAATAKLKFARIAAMDSRGNSPAGEPAAGLPADPEFLSAAFSADAGADNDPISAKSGAIYIVRVNGTTPPKLKPLAEVRADAQTQWIARRRGELLAARAKTLTDQAVKQKSLESVATAMGSTVQKSPALSRDTNTPAISSAIVGKLFEARPDGIVFAPHGDGYIIARLTGIAHPKPQPGDKEFPTQAQALAAGVAADMTITMAASARGAQNATVNQQNLNSVLGEGQ